MRKVYDFQTSIDRIHLDEIEFDLNSRDDTVSYLAGFLAIIGWRCSGGAHHFVGEIF